MRDSKLAISKIKTRRIASMSPRRRREYPEYRVLCDRFLDDNELCWSCGEHTPRHLRQCHHKRGRAGKLYLETRFWMMLCADCHAMVHREPKLAVARGLLAGAGEWGYCPR